MSTSKVHVPATALRPINRMKTLAERGLTTIEYAIGLVAAATAAIVLLRIFNDNEFFRALFDWVLSIFQQMATHI